MPCFRYLGPTWRTSFVPSSTNEVLRAADTSGVRSLTFTVRTGPNALPLPARLWSVSLYDFLTLKIQQLSPDFSNFRWGRGVVAALSEPNISPPISPASHYFSRLHRTHPLMNITLKIDRSCKRLVSCHFPLYTPVYFPYDLIKIFDLWPVLIDRCHI